MGTTVGLPDLGLLLVSFDLIGNDRISVLRTNAVNVLSFLVEMRSSTEETCSACYTWTEVS